MLEIREYDDGIAFYKDGIGEVIFYNIFSNTLSYRKYTILTLEEEGFVHHKIRNFRFKKAVKEMVDFDGVLQREVQ